MEVALLSQWSTCFIACDSTGPFSPPLLNVNNLTLCYSPDGTVVQDIDQELLPTTNLSQQSQRIPKLS